MNHVDERTERLIVRMLDGEITSTERLELDRELIRSPQARALLESYQTIDAASVEVIGRVIGKRDQGHSELVVSSGQPVSVQPRRSNWMLYASALAACLAFAIFLGTPTSQQNGASPPPAVAQNTDRQSHQDLALPPPGSAFPQGNGQLTPVLHSPGPRLDRTTDRDVIFMVGSDGRLYMVEVNRIQEIKLPGSLDDVGLVRTPM
jgi:hypothetical protein